MLLHRIGLTATAALGVAALVVGTTVAEKKYDTGATDTEIKIGNTNPYSGPASAYGTIGKTITAFFNKVNAEGGINGRKVNFISYDDGYSPPKTVEQARKLVESDEVLFLFNTLGTPPNTAIQKYMNSKKVPQLFVATGATKWGDHKDFPWTMGWQPTYQAEGHIYAKYLLEHHPQGKIGILYQNDDYGKDYVKGLKDGLVGKMPIVAELPYETTDPTVDSLLNNVSQSVGGVLQPAGLENSKGILSSYYLKDPTDPQWKDDAAYKDWVAFMEKYYPEGDRTSTFPVYGYTASQTVVQVLKQCGDELTRANVMKQAANLKDLSLGMLLPGVKINTSATDWYPIKQMQMQQFDGQRWIPIGPILSGELSGT